jgi:prevent-host-death family protein
MARTITQREPRNNSGEIMHRLDRGEEYRITRNGVPVGVLSPISRRRFVSADALVAAFAGAPPIDSAHFFADIGAIADPGPGEWE